LATVAVPSLVSTRTVIWLGEETDKSTGTFTICWPNSPSSTLTSPILSAGTELKSTIVPMPTPA
jgi:hypothetical protein